MGRQHQGMDWPGVRQIPEGSGEQGKMEKTGRKIICGDPTTPTVKEMMTTTMMMMTMMMMMISVASSSGSFSSVDFVTSARGREFDSW